MESEASNQGIYDDTGTNGGQPTTESTLPEGGGTRSLNASGGNKRDPVSAGPNLGDTIAGRTSNGDVREGVVGTANPGSYQARSMDDIRTGHEEGKRTGGPEQGKGVTGFEGTTPMANKPITEIVDPTVDREVGSPD